MQSERDGRLILTQLKGESMKLAQARTGERLKVNKKLIPYSFWPVNTGSKGNSSILPLLFSLDPWAIIDQAIKNNCPNLSKSEALACVHQARDFYESAIDTQRVSARPLSLYYCFMNLVKAFCLTRGTQVTFDKAQHGLTEQLGTGGKELHDAYLEGFPSPNARGKLQNFSEFMQALTGAGLTAPQQYKIPILLPQILPGHRLWSSAANKKERFVAVHEIRPYVNKESGEIWLNIYFVSDDLSRIGITTTNFLLETDLAGSYTQVSCAELDNLNRKLICFQQTTPFICNTRKYANYLQGLFDSIRPYLWVTVSTIPPYRRHYVYTRPSTDSNQVLPQLLSIYALSYYLGSITRYRPHHLPTITDTVFGPRVQDFITGQPQQFLYLMASEFAKREVTKPSIL